MSSFNNQIQCEETFNDDEITQELLKLLYSEIETVDSYEVIMKYAC